MYIRTQPGLAVVVDLWQCRHHKCSIKRKKVKSSMWSEGGSESLEPKLGKSLRPHCPCMFSSPNPLHLSHVLLLLVCSNPLLAFFQFSAQDDLEIKASGSGRGTISVSLVSHHEVLSWKTSCTTPSPLLVGIEAVYCKTRLKSAIILATM